MLLSSSFSEQLLNQLWCGEVGTEPPNRVLGACARMPHLEQGEELSKVPQL